MMTSLGLVHATHGTSVAIDRVAMRRPIDIAAVKRFPRSGIGAGLHETTGTFSLHSHPLVGCLQGTISEKQDEPAREYQ
jgi:hypothetical protein